MCGVVWVFSSSIETLGRKPQSRASSKMPQLRTLVAILITACVLLSLYSHSRMLEGQTKYSAIMRALAPHPLRHHRTTSPPLFSPLYPPGTPPPTAPTPSTTPPPSPYLRNVGPPLPSSPASPPTAFPSFRTSSPPRSTSPPHPRAKSPPLFSPLHSNYSHLLPLAVIGFPKTGRN